MSRILVVEDDERIRSSMRLALEDEGYTVEDVGSGEDAIARFTAEPCELALIDLMLPGIDGFETCRALRRMSTVPVIMVTARSDTHDVVAGLEAGADDYVTKPFVAKELAARIRALLRRSRTEDGTSAVLSFGDVEIEPDAGVVRRAGEEVHCTRTEFRLLCELANHPGSCWSGSGGTTTSATGAWSMCTSVDYAPRSSPIPPLPASSSPCGAWATSWRSDAWSVRRTPEGPGRPMLPVPDGPGCPGGSVSGRASPWRSPWPPSDFRRSWPGSPTSLPGPRS